MSINFTDAQLKQMVEDTLNLPLMIDNPTEGTGLIQQKGKIQEAKDALIITDEQHKLFTDHWNGVDNSYHQELTKLNKEVRTLYSESDLVNGAKTLPPHYTETWIGLVPIVIPSNNGLPFSVSSNQSEVELIDNIQYNLNKLVNGFGANNYSSSLDSNYVAGSGVMQFNTTPPQGTELLVYGGGHSMLIVVGTTTGSCSNSNYTNQVDCTSNGGIWTSITNITVKTADYSFSSGTDVKDYHAGFNNSERGRQTTNYANDVLIFLEDETTTKVNTWKNSIIDQRNFLNNNDDTNPTRKQINEAYKLTIQAVLDAIDSWLLIPVTDVNGRFTDTHLPEINSTLTGRESVVPNRVNEIVSNLGNVSQDAEGNVSGDGSYFDLFEFIKLRIAKSGGTLYSYYGMDLGTKHFDTKIAGANKQLAEYTNMFTIQKIVDDVDAGSNEFDVADASNYAISDNVEVYDSESVISSLVILDIIGNTIITNNGVPTGLSDGRLVRIN